MLLLSYLGRLSIGGLHVVKNYLYFTVVAKNNHAHM